MAQAAIAAAVAASGHVAQAPADPAAVACFTALFAQFGTAPSVGVIDNFGIVPAHLPQGQHKYGAIVIPSGFAPDNLMLVDTIGTLITYAATGAPAIASPGASNFVGPGVVRCSGSGNHCITIQGAGPHLVNRPMHVGPSSLPALVASRLRRVGQVTASC